MSRLRHSTVTLAVAALLAGALALVAAPAAAQDDDDPPPPPPEFFVFTNVMTNPTTDSDNDGVPDTRWQVQVVANALGNCVPERGSASWASTWINAGEQTGVSLATRECVFRIAAQARVERTPDCAYRAELAWGTSPSDSDYRDGSVLTSSRPANERRLAIRRDAGVGCAKPHRTYFVLNSAGIVEDLPAGSADSALTARARRAATLGPFTVRVEREPGSPAAGCDVATTFTVRGELASSPQTLGATGDRCPARASFTSVPAHLKIVEGDYVAFDAALPNILVDLSSLLRMETARIAIVQDVAGSANRGEARYVISRFCGGVTLASPAPQVTSTSLLEGRFTVHSPDIAQFGPTAIYPAVATSHNSNVVEGCSVSVTVSGLPAVCTAAGSNTQTLAWTAADPVSHFDFEFDITCGSVPPPSTPAAASSPGTDGQSTQPPAEAVEASGLAEVRIVARKLANARIEFGLQQRQEDDTWGRRILPNARFFPADAAVGRWLLSSPVAVRVAASADASASDVGLRITARLTGDGRVEFALQQRLDGGSWGDRQAPRRRFLPADTAVGRWLHSSAVDLAV